MLLWALLIVGLTGALGYDHQMYEGYRVVETIPKTESQRTSLAKFAEEQMIDIWTGPKIGITNEIFVGQDKFGLLKSFLASHGMGFTISSRNVAEELKSEWDRLVGSGRTTSRVYDPNDYNTIDDIYDELDRLAGTCAGQGLTCSVTTFGPTLEGRDMRAIHVSSGAGRPTVVFDSMIHAREWLAGTTVMRILDRLITGYGTDAESTAMLDANDFVITPVVNPDGFSYTWTNDRMWRKNRRENAGSSCLGVDLNRNYNANWGDLGGGSNNPCSETFFGESAESEPATQAYTAFLLNSANIPSPDILVHFHTHGYMLLHPYGDGRDPASPDFGPATIRTCAAIENTHGTNWDCGNTMDVLYEISGGIIDWAIDAAGFRLAYLPELRNDGQGFTPGPDSIQPSYEEMWNGVYALVMDP